MDMRYIRRIYHTDDTRPAGFRTALCRFIICPYAYKGHRFPCYRRRDCHIFIRAVIRDNADRSVTHHGIIEMTLCIILKRIGRCEIIITPDRIKSHILIGRDLSVQLSLVVIIRSIFRQGIPRKCIPLPINVAAGAGSGSDRIPLKEDLRHFHLLRIHTSLSISRIIGDYHDVFRPDGVKLHISRHGDLSTGIRAVNGSLSVRLRGPSGNDSIFTGNINIVHIEIICCLIRGPVRLKILRSIRIY